MNFRQAEAYRRRFHFLVKLTLPEGASDFAKNLPPQDCHLIGPSVELVARRGLHPALSDPLIQAAQETHSGPGMYREAGEYPAPHEREFPISPDADRYYKTGSRFFYRHLPFWLASLADRLVVLLVPLLVLIVPVSKALPAFYRWRIRSRIYRWYGALMAIEREMLSSPTPEVARRSGPGWTPSNVPSTSSSCRWPMPISSTCCATTWPWSAVASRPASTARPDLGFPSVLPWTAMVEDASRGLSFFDDVPAEVALTPQERSNLSSCV